MTQNYITDGEYTGWTRYTSGVNSHPSEHGPCEGEGRTTGRMGPLEKPNLKLSGLGMARARESGYWYAVMGVACVSGGRNGPSYDG